MKIYLRNSLKCKVFFSKTNSKNASQFNTFNKLFNYSTKTKNEILDEEYSSILKKLYDVNRFSAKKVNLENITRACEIFGNPHKNLNYIHVTGTNGKGSVCKKLASVFEFAGFKTGLYISPHITTFRERIQINSKFINKEKIVELLKYIFDIVSKNSISLTYFEYVTLLCFLYFKENNVDIAIMEVGLGGNLDSTNIITPLLSVVTSIGLDHTNSLGFTQEEIAEKKAGIIKQNIPCIIGPDCFPRNVFIKHAINNNSKIYILENSLNTKNKTSKTITEFESKYQKINKNNLVKFLDFSNNQNDKFGINSEFKTNLFDFDFENKMIANYIIEIFNENYPNFSGINKNNVFDETSQIEAKRKEDAKNNLKNQEIILHGIEQKQPCRKEDVIEVLGKDKVQKAINTNVEKLFLNTKTICNNQEILKLINIKSLQEQIFIDLKCKKKQSRIKSIFLDVGHNAHGLEKLLYSIRINNPESFIRVVTGYSSGKDQKDIIKVLCSYADKIYFASADHQRALPYDILMEKVKELCSDYRIDQSIFSHFDNEKEFYKKLIFGRKYIDFTLDKSNIVYNGNNLADQYENFFKGYYFILFKFFSKIPIIK